LSSREHHIARIKSLPCVVCVKVGLPPPPISDAHHLEHESRDKDSDFATVPLCKEHHQGATGYHGIGGERGMVMRYKLNHDDMMKLTMKAYVKEYVR